MVDAHVLDDAVLLVAPHEEHVAGKYGFRVHADIVNSTFTGPHINAELTAEVFVTAADDIAG